MTGLRRWFNLGLRRVRVALAMVLVITVTGCERSNKKPTPTTAPATQPMPATTQAIAPPRPMGYVDVLRTQYPRLSSTQPLDFTLNFTDAGHFVLKRPIYLDWRGDLWITHPDAAPTAEVLKQAANEQTHVLREPVAFAHWTPDKKGKTHPHLIVKTASGKYEWVDEAGRKPIGSGKNYQWHRAVAWDDEQIVVPSDKGISVINIASEPIEQYQELSAAGAGEPAFVFEPSGLIAWIPWQGDKPGSDGAWRFSEKTWTHLPSGWPQKIVHLVPLLDGSVLQLSAGEGGTLQLSMTALSGGSVDEDKITELVKQMSDPDADKRQVAFNELTRYGNASWPILEKLKDNQPLEARSRIEQLLENKTQPTLGGRTLVDGKARLVSRFPDGGILLYADAGVSVPREDKPPVIVTPAWISIRPGKAIELLDEVLTQDLDPDSHHVMAWSDEWVVSDPTAGPRRLEGNHLQPLVKEDEASFVHLVGIDRRGRWLFRKSPDAPDTLILDTTIPDPTPRLPIWLLDVKKGEVGWEKSDWPVIKRPGAWYLNEYGWQALDEKINPIITSAIPWVSVGMPTLRSAPGEATVQPTTMAATLPAAPTTQAATKPSGPALLVDSEGRQYYDGIKTLTVIDKTGRQTVWPLPDAALGKGEVHLVQAKDGSLFLFNSPGRALKIKSTTGSTSAATRSSSTTTVAQPFTLDATFTHRMPNEDHFTRVWVDPANRIIMAYNTHLAILFPEGRIPPALQRLIPAQELEDQGP